MVVCKMAHLVSSSDNYPALKATERLSNSSYCTCFELVEGSLTHTMVAVASVKSEASKHWMSSY